MPATKPITPGTRFARLTVLTESKKVRYPSGQIHISLKCRCDCGTVKFFTKGSLVSGNSKSCGCWNIQALSNRVKYGKKTRTSRIYNIWRGMLNRCNNVNLPIYEYYGARGIKVCERWRKFENFLVDMGEPPEGHSIDRLNNDGNYDPENCAWRSRKEQCRNRRSNVFWTHNGETKTQAEWAEIAGLSPNAFVGRLWRGMTIGEILDVPKLSGGLERLQNKRRIV